MKVGNGHCGITRRLVQSLLESAGDLVGKEPLKPSAVLAFLVSPWMLSRIENTRAVPEVVDSAHQHILRMLLKGEVDTSDLKAQQLSDAVSRLVRYGLVCVKNERLYFACPAFRQISVTRALRSSTWLRSCTIPANLDDLLLQALERFDPVALRKAAQHPVEDLNEEDLVLLEATWQHEFYRAVLDLIPEGIAIYAEVSWCVGCSLCHARD